MSFADFKVLGMNLDNSLKIISLTMSGAWIKLDGKCIELGNGCLTITNYNSIKITSYDAVNDIDADSNPWSSLQNTSITHHV